MGRQIDKTVKCSKRTSTFPINQDMVCECVSSLTGKESWKRKGEGAGCLQSDSKKNGGVMS